MIIIDEQKLTPNQRRIWQSKAVQLAKKGVTVIDPWRKPLRDLRAELQAARVSGFLYRASTGGTWGRSAQFILL